MRTIWLAVIAVAWGAGTSVHAQEGMLEKMPVHSIYTEVREGWAVQSPYRGAAVQPAQATAESPPASLGAPVAQPIGPPPAQGGCHGGGCTVGGRGCACRPTFCDRLLAWLAFKPHHCCCGLARCCHVPPLYLFFLGECTEGAHHEYPACCCDCSGLWHGCPNKGSGQGCCGNP